MDAGHTQLGHLTLHKQRQGSRAPTSEVWCRCDALVSRVHACAPGRELLHLVDEISDVVCCATDAANFCQVVHSDAAWKEAAQQASTRLNTYVAKLNTDNVLFEGLQASMEQADRSVGAGETSWTAEDLKVGDSLMHEFRQSGMGLSEGVQGRNRELVGHEQRLCQQLMQFEVRRPLPCCLLGR